MTQTAVQTGEFNPRALQRPIPRLLNYFIIVSLFFGPAAPLVFLPALFKYITLRYRLDDDGVSMAWGVLWRREIYLTHRRIQDIHVTRNLIERWMGLAKVAIQTASGAAASEMVILGALDAEILRDFLYTKMRGARDEAAGGATDGGERAGAAPADEALSLLREIRDELRLRRDAGGAAS